MKTLKDMGLGFLLPYLFNGVLAVLIGLGGITLYLGSDIFSISGVALAVVATAVFTAIATFTFHLFHGGFVKRTYVAVTEAVTNAIHSVMRPIVLKRLNLSEGFVLRLSQTGGIIDLKTLEDLITIATQGGAKINAQFFAGISQLGLMMGFQLTYLEDARKVKSNMEDIINAIPTERQNAADYHKQALEQIEKQRQTAVFNYERVESTIAIKESEARNRQSQMTFIIGGVVKAGGIPEDNGELSLVG